MYAVMCEALGRPHRLKRMVLLAPAGFHVKFPKVSHGLVRQVRVMVSQLGSWPPDAHGAAGAPAGFYVKAPEVSHGQSPCLVNWTPQQLVYESC